MFKTLPPKQALIPKRSNYSALWALAAMESLCLTCTVEITELILQQQVAASLIPVFNPRLAPEKAAPPTIGALALV